MERAFIVGESCTLYQEQKSYETNLKKQRAFVNRFFEENGIESDKYLVTGNGLVNVPFKDTAKGDIRLGIVPTENDGQKFNGQLRVPDSNGVSYFKKSSKIAKRFSEQCIADNIVINIWKPMVRDYFKSIRYGQSSSRCFEHNGKVYLSISGKELGADELPDGFEEIKMSELYRVIEEIEAKEKAE